MSFWLSEPAALGTPGSLEDAIGDDEDPAAVLIGVFSTMSGVGAETTGFVLVDFFTAAGDAIFFAGFMGEEVVLLVVDVASKGIGRFIVVVAKRIGCSCGDEVCAT